MKMVIYKRFGHLYVTTEENYNAQIPDAHANCRCIGFETAEEIVAYYCEYCGSKPEDFTIISEE